MAAEKNVSIIVGAKDAFSQIFGKLKGSFTEINQAVELAKKVWAGLEETFENTIGAAADEQEIFERLNNSIELVGAKSETASPKINQFLREMQDTTRYGDGEMAGVLQKLITLTGDFSDETFDAAKIVADMAASGMFDLESAARYVGMAMSGNVEMLARYIPQLKASSGLITENMSASEKWAVASKLLREHMGGMAQHELGTFNSETARLKNEIEDVGEAIGYIFLPAATEVVSTFADWARNVSLAITPQLEFNEAVRQGAQVFKDYKSEISETDPTLNDYLDTLMRTGQMPDPKPVVPENTEDILAGAKSGLEALNESLKNQSATLDATYSSGSIGGKLLGDLENHTNKAKENLGSLWDWVDRSSSEEADKFKKTWDDAFQAYNNTSDDSITASFDRMAEINGMKKASDDDYLKNLKSNFDLTEEQWAQLLGITVAQYRAQVKAAKEAEDEKARLAQNAKNIIANGAYALNRQLVDAMFGARLNLQEVWKGIAKDFMMMFLEEVERAIAKAVISWLAKLALFDQHDNDMMAMKSGLDYASFFVAGVDEGMAKADLGRRFIGYSALSGLNRVTPSAANITININNPIGTEEYVRANVVPAIEALARRLETNIVINEPAAFLPEYDPYNMQIISGGYVVRRRR